MRRGDERGAVCYVHRVMLMKVLWEVLFLEAPGARAVGGGLKLWASWASLPGRQAGCGLKRMWEFFDFEISREERQTLWECLCDGGPVEMLAKQWIGLYRVFSDTQHLCREMWNGKKRICERGGGCGV